MENTKKWTGWILIAAILLITIVALAMNSIAGGKTKTDDILSQYQGILKELFPQTAGTTDGFERLDNGDGGFVYRLKQADGDRYAVQQIVQGYIGPVEVISALSSDGTLLGIYVGGKDFRETEGLGGKTRDAAFTDQFSNQRLPVTLGKEIDAVSGATVTSQAVVDAVNLSLHRLQSTADVQYASNTQTRTANASVIGYGGPVLVHLTLDENGVITALDVGGARFMETQGVGSRVREEAFTSQLIGLSTPVALNKDFDAVSGATVSSQAVADAVNEAAAFLEESGTN